MCHASESTLCVCGFGTIDLCIGGCPCVSYIWRSVCTSLSELTLETCDHRVVCVRVNCAINIFICLFVCLCVCVRGVRVWCVCVCVVCVCVCGVCIFLCSCVSLRVRTCWRARGGEGRLGRGSERKKETPIMRAVGLHRFLGGSMWHWHVMPVCVLHSIPSCKHQATSPSAFLSLLLCLSLRAYFWAHLSVSGLSLCL